VTHFGESLLFVRILLPNNWKLVSHAVFPDFFSIFLKNCFKKEGSKRVAVTMIQVDRFPIHDTYPTPPRSPKPRMSRRDSGDATNNATQSTSSSTQQPAYASPSALHATAATRQLPPLTGAPASSLLLQVCAPTRSLPPPGGVRLN
jgi:hypothetical protein